MDTILACKAAVSWIKSRAAIVTKQQSLRAAVDCSAAVYLQSTLPVKQLSRPSKRK